MIRTNAPPLAIELVLDILEIVQEEELRNVVKRPTIVQCATVCKAWAPICQALLFRNVALPTLRQSMAFVSAVKDTTDKADWLRGLVRSFEVLVSDEEDGRVITQLAFAHLMQMLPNVEELRLFYYCLRPLDYATLDVLRTIKAPASLSLRCAQDPSPLWDLLTVWPTIDHLEVVSWEMPASQPTKPPTGVWSPYEVRWLDESDSAEATLPRLLRPGNLRILQLMKTPEAAFFTDLLAKHGPYLRSLRLKSVSEDVAEELRYCTALEEFKYLSIPSEAVLASLPGTIEHLSFQNATTTQRIGHVIDWIERHAPRLRAVTYNACGLQTEREYVHLVDVCRAKSISLRCFADTPPTRESEPLVRPTRFPRPVPLTPSRRPVPSTPAALRESALKSLSTSSSSLPSSTKFNPSSAYYSSSTPAAAKALIARSGPLASRLQPPVRASTVPLGRTRPKPRRQDTPQGFFGITLGL